MKSFDSRTQTFINVKKDLIKVLVLSFESVCQLELANLIGFGGDF